MSNLIRSHVYAELDTKVIEARTVQFKKIESFSPEIIQDERFMVNKRDQLATELQQLEAAVASLKLQLDEERVAAAEQMEAWRQQQQEEAQEEMQRLAELAKKQGFSEGYEAGWRLVHCDLNHQQEEMNRLIEGAYEEKANIVQSAEPFLLAMSVKIAGKIIAAELRQYPDQLSRLVRNALQQVKDRGEIVIQASPGTYAEILPYLVELEQCIDAGSELKLVPMQDSREAACIIHTPSGSYDISIDSQLSEIKKRLISYCEEQEDGADREVFAIY